MCGQQNLSLNTTWLEYELTNYTKLNVHYKQSVMEDNYWRRVTSKTEFTGWLSARFASGLLNPYLFANLAFIGRSLSW